MDSRIRPRMAKPALLYAGVVLGKKTCLRVTKCLRNTSLVQPLLPYAQGDISCSFSAGKMLGNAAPRPPPVRRSVSYTASVVRSCFARGTLD